VTDSTVALAWPAGVPGAILLALELGILTFILEGIVRALAPPPEQDPRLGSLPFWLIVAVVALAMPVLVPARRASGLAERSRADLGAWRRHGHRNVGPAEHRAVALTQLRC
jgi:hypothetical protein